MKTYVMDGMKPAMENNAEENQEENQETKGRLRREIVIKMVLNSGLCLQ